MILRTLTVVIQVKKEKRVEIWSKGWIDSRINSLGDLVRESRATTNRLALLDTQQIILDNTEHSTTSPDQERFGFLG
jgi:hypothetical protein